jgi:hypothetical protein
MSRDRGGEHDPEKPSAPGWYPDPWSATGDGERYFDGEKWGSSERPLGRLTVVDLEEHRKQRGRKKSAPGPKTSRWRLPSHLRPVALLVALVLLIWGVPKLFQHDSKPATVGGTDDTVHVSPLSPPAGAEEAAKPRGTPAPTPTGPGKYEVANTQSDTPSVPVAFDPCRPIHYVVDTKGAPADGLTLVQRAIARIQRASGLQFVYDGPTDEAATNNRAPYLPQRYSADRWAPVLIAWDNESDFPQLAGYIAGVTSPRPVSVPDNPDRLVYVTGSVVLDSGDLAVAHLPDRALAQAMIMHELGHLVGLGHTNDRTQLMFSEAQANVKDFGAGDLRGLALLGTQACYPSV